MRKVRKHSKSILYLLIITNTLFFTAAIYSQHVSFTTHNPFDKAIIYQLFWNTLHGEYFYSSIHQMYYFSAHTALIFTLIFPLYALYPHMLTLSLISSLAISLGALPVYWLARERLNSRPTALAFAVIYLGYPALSFMYLESVKAVIFSAPLLLFTFYYFQKKDFKKFLAFMILSLLCKQNIALVIFMFGVYALVTSRGKKWVLAPLFAGAFWFLLAFKVINPYFLHLSDLPARAPLWFSRYEYLGESFSEVLKTVVLHPLYVLEHVLIGEKFRYLFLLFLPLGFLPLLKLRILLIPLPIFAQNLLSTHAAQYSINFHYNAAIVPFLVIAAIYGVERLSRSKKPETLRKKNLVLPFLIIFLLMCSAYSMANYGAQEKAFNAINSHDDKDRTKAVRALIETIPDNASVSSSMYLAPALSNRKELYVFPVKSREADYVILDPAWRRALWGNETYYNNAVRELLGDLDYHLIAIEKPYVLFKKSGKGMEDEERSRLFLNPWSGNLYYRLGVNEEHLKLSLDPSYKKPGGEEQELCFIPQKSYNCTLNRSAFIVPRKAILTRAEKGQVGQLWYDAVVKEDFNISFDFRVGGGSGGDGMVFMFYKDGEYNAGGGGSLGFGKTSGYGVEFDTWKNDVQDDPTKGHIALIEGSAGNHMAYYNYSFDDQWHRAKVEVEENRVTVYIDNEKVLEWEGKLDRRFGGMGFSAASGGSTNWHMIKDMELKSGRDMKEDKHFNCTLNRSAFVVPKKAILTRAEEGKVGQLWYDAVVKEDFNISFDFRVGGGSGGDGMVFMFYKDREYNAGGGGSLGFGKTSGYGVEFDTWKNDVQDDPTKGHIALIEGSAGNHMAYYNYSFDDQWHRAKVEVEENRVTVYIDNEKVLEWEGKLDRRFGGMGFSATSGGNTNWHMIKDMELKSGGGM